MNKENKEIALIILLGIAVVLGIFLIALCPKWYAASVQRAVYERQGVQMTTWEVMWGAKPVVRQIVTDKQEDKK